MRTRVWWCCLAAVGLACVSSGVDYTWQGGSGLFSDGAKWSPEGVPAAGDTAKFSTAADGTVTWTGAVENNQMQVVQTDGATLTLDLGGNTYTLTNRFYFDSSKASSYVVLTNGFLVAPTNICEMKINAGVAPARLTFAAGATASVDRLNTWRSDVTVGEGAILTCNNECKIGDGQANSVSALNVNGGTLTLNHNLWMNGGNSSTSTLNIAGGTVIAKKYFSIGNGGGGTGWGVVNLTGGYLETLADIWLGNSSSTRGVANISGGLWVPRGQFEVAHGGYTVAWLNMSGGEIVMPVSGKAFIVANGANGHMTTGIVSMTGGRISVTNNAAFNVGNASNSLGLVYLGGAGEIHARDFKLGTYRDGRGECVATGGYLRAENYVGLGTTAGGAGGMIVDGGEVSTKQVNLGDVIGGLGWLAVSNGQIRTEGKFYVGYSGTGTLVIAGGILIASNDVAVGSGWPGSGEVMMTGGGILCSNSVKIGDWGGVGTFDMRGGTVWAPNSVIVGNGNGSTGTLVMSGGRIATPQNVTLGNNMQKGAWGTLSMSGGELIASNTLILGSSVTNWGNATVTDGWIEVNNMTVGGNGRGDWEQSGGVLTVRSNLVIGNGGVGTGTVSFAGGSLTVWGSLTAAISGCGDLSVFGGELTVSNSLHSGDTLNSRGTLTLAGGVVASKGGNWGNRGIAQVLVSGGTNAFSGTVQVGVYTQAVLVVSGGSNTFPNLYIARNNAGSSADMTVTGGRTLVTGYLDIGQFGRGTLTMEGGEVTTRFLRMNPGTSVSPVPPQSEIRVAGGRLQVNEACYMPDTASITGRLTLAGGVLAVPVLRQHWGRMHVLFDGGTVEATRAEANFIRELDWFALTGNGLVVDSAGFAIGSSLVFPDADGERGRLVKRGAGTFTLNAVNTFTGPVVVEGGELALGAGGLITLAGGCEVDGGALLNLSATNLNFTLPAATVSRVDGELRLASGRTLTVANGATLGGTGVVGRVVFESGAALAREAGAALLTATECVIPAGAVIALTGYSAAELRQGVPVVAGETLTVAGGNTVQVTLDGVAQPTVALRVADGTLTAYAYNPATLIRIL